MPALRALVARRPALPAASSRESSCIQALPTLKTTPDATPWRKRPANKAAGVASAARNTRLAAAERAAKGRTSLRRP